MSEGKSGGTGKICCANCAEKAGSGAFDASKACLSRNFWTGAPVLAASDAARLAVGSCRA